MPERAVALLIYLIVAIVLIVLLFAIIDRV